MAASKWEHLLVDRIVPVLLIVIIPVFGALWVADKRQHEQRRDQLREACERGNDIRRDQKIVLELLAQASAVLSVGAAEKDVRRYFRDSVLTLRVRRDRIEIIDCTKVIS